MTNKTAIIVDDLNKTESSNVAEETKKVIYVDDLNKTESSNVASVAYQEKTKKAFVTFSNGGLYEYRGVEREDFETLRDAESVGRHLRNVFLKKDFEYEKLIDTELSHLVLTKEVLEEAKNKVLDGEV